MDGNGRPCPSLPPELWDEILIHVLALEETPDLWDWCEPRTINGTISTRLRDHLAPVYAVPCDRERIIARFWATNTFKVYMSDVRAHPLPQNELFKRIQSGARRVQNLHIFVGWPSGDYASVLMLRELAGIDLRTLTWDLRDTKGKLGSLGYYPSPRRPGLMEPPMGPSGQEFTAPTIFLELLERGAGIDLNKTQSENGGGGVHILADTRLVARMISGLVASFEAIERRQRVALSCQA